MLNLIFLVKLAVALSTFKRSLFAPTGVSNTGNNNESNLNSTMSENEAQGDQKDCVGGSDGLVKNGDGIPDNGSPAPSGIYINSIKFGGTGCSSQHSTTAAYSETSKVISLKFEEFIASTGTGIRPSESRKQCQIFIDLRYPVGWSYSYGSVQYRGNLNLPSSFAARQTATYFFAGATGKQTSLQTIFKGPKDNEDYIIDDEFPDNKLWSDCNLVQPAVIKVAIELKGNMELDSSFSVSKIEKRVTQDYGVSWRKCT